ncbi:hypothetical protein RUM43_008001 [Polyplax serrata]|uniref:Homeobox domain-containing protein n=1 Tax=Polyplax serrata TaxID=468196 RepID=A0AAN8PN73_POLSC
MSLISSCTKRCQQRSNSDFTIDHILNVAGEKHKKENCLQPSFTGECEHEKFDWLNCTRYRPPKLPRQRRKEGVVRRKLGRNPRIPFSSSQIAFLEAKFLQTPYLSSSDVTQLAGYLKLTETRNRRAREKRESENKNKIKEQVKRDSPIIVENMSETPMELLLQPSNFMLNCNDPFRYFKCIESPDILEVPLDLSERHFITRPE